MTLHLGFGPLTLQRGRNDTRDWPTLYRDALEVAVEAEAAGFKSIWVGEHHFTNDGYLPAVFPMLAALAARTDDVLLGTKVMLPALHHPLRVAEDAAAVSVLSGGRLVLGMGVGYRREEFSAFGRDRSRRAQLLVECVEVCRKAWAGQPFDHRGPSVDVAELTVLPAGGDIPIWLGGRAPAALERAGRIADGFVAPAGPTSDVANQLEAVDRASHAADRAPLPLSSSMQVLVGRPPSASVEQGFHELLDGYAALTASDNPTTRIGQGDARATVAAEGEPASIAEQIVERGRVGGAHRDHHVTVRLDYPGMSKRDVLGHLDRFVTQVMPLIDAGTA